MTSSPAERFARQTAIARNVVIGIVIAVVLTGGGVTGWFYYQTTVAANGTANARALIPEMENAITEAELIASEADQLLDRRTRLADNAEAQYWSLLNNQRHFGSYLDDSISTASSRSLEANERKREAEAGANEARANIDQAVLARDLGRSLVALAQEEEASTWATVLWSAIITVIVLVIVLGFLVPLALAAGRAKVTASSE